MRRLYWWFEWPIKNLVLALYSILYSPISITWLLNLSSRSSPSTMNSTVRAWPRQICSNLFLFLGANLHLRIGLSSRVCWPKKQCGRRRAVVVFLAPAILTLIVIIVYASPWHHFFFQSFCLFFPVSKPLKDTKQNNAKSVPLWIGSLLCALTTAMGMVLLRSSWSWVSTSMLIFLAT